MSEIKTVIDYDFLESIVDGDGEFIRELYDIFIQSSNTNITKLDESYDSGDVNVWYSSSHAFKGAASSIGAFDFANILEESQKNPNYDKEQKKILLDKIKVQFSDVKNSLEKYLLEKYNINVNS